MRLKFKKLMLGDVCVAVLSFYLALRIRFDIEDTQYELFSRSLERLGIFVAVLITVSFLFEMYSLSRHRKNLQLLLQIVCSVAVSFVILSIIIYINPGWMIGRGLVAISLALFVLLQFSWHVLFRKVVDLPYLAEKVIIIGTGETARRIGELVAAVADANHSLLGYVQHASASGTAAAVASQEILGDMAALPGVIKRASATLLVVVEPHQLDDSTSQHLLMNCKLKGVEIVTAPAYFETVSEKLMLEQLDMNDLIYSTGFRLHPVVAVFKRVFDVVASLAGILLILPLLPLIVLLVKLNAPGPLLYRQTRVGYLGRHFDILKFRTMAPDAERDSGAVWAQHNDPRIRPIGRFLRKSRLDEVPQLINVFKGDMSFIGPRPERPEFVENLQESFPFYGIRHFLKPGITGWAQIKHPYGASMAESFEKLRYDLYYFKHMNPLLDAIIILKTIKVVFSQFGGR